MIKPINLNIRTRTRHIKARKWQMYIWFVSSQRAGRVKIVLIPAGSAEQAKRKALARYGPLVEILNWAPAIVEPDEIIYLGDRRPRKRK